MSRAITWNAGSPFQVVRMLVSSMTVEVPSCDLMRASPCSKNWPSSVSCARRSSMPGMSPASTMSVTGRP